MLITPGIHGSESPLTFTPAEHLFQASCYCNGEPREGRESACGKSLRSEVVSIGRVARYSASRSINAFEEMSAATFDEPRFPQRDLDRSDSPDSQIGRASCRER